MAKVRKALRVSIVKEGESYKLLYEGVLGSTDLEFAGDSKVKKYVDLPEGLSESDLSKVFDVVSAAFNTEQGIE